MKKGKQELPEGLELISHTSKKRENPKNDGALELLFVRKEDGAATITLEGSPVSAMEVIIVGMIQDKNIRKIILGAADFYQQEYLK